MTLLSWCSIASRVAAQESWAVTARAADPNDASVARTVGDLLATELRAQGAAQARVLTVSCSDSSCTRGAAQGIGAHVAAHVDVHRLGQKYIVSATAVDVSTGATRMSQRMTSQRVDELDLVAQRLATALITQRPVEEGAELGTITQTEEKAPARRSGRFGFLLGLSTLAPFAGYADKQYGGGFEAGIWFETYDFVLEPRLAVRFDLTDERETWMHVPLEITGSYLFSRGDISPLLGLGAGLGYVHESIYAERTTGEVLVTHSHTKIVDELLGGTLIARAGMLFLRTYDVSMLVTLDYSITFASFEERVFEHGVSLHLDLVLGGT